MAADMANFTLDAAEVAPPHRPLPADGRGRHDSAIIDAYRDAMPDATPSEHHGGGDDRLYVPPRTRPGRRCCNRPRRRRRSTLTCSTGAPRSAMECSIPAYAGGAVRVRHRAGGREAGRYRSRYRPADEDDGRDLVRFCPWRRPSEPAPPGLAALFGGRAEHDAAIPREQNREQPGRRSGARRSKRCHCSNTVCQ